ncbi:family S53 protease [Mycena leptocephala]|nr:family S53 protease [Mycena leptocephala]
MLIHLAALFPLLVGVHCEFVLLERRNNPPSGFSRVGSPPASDILSFRLALAQSDIQGLHDTVYEISTPGNPRYGHHSWLSSNNLTASPITSSGDWISVNMSVSQANTLLAADFGSFQDENTNQTVVRTLSYSIPSGLKTSIEWIHPTIRVTNASPPTASISPNCRSVGSWTPVCIQELYGIPSTPAKPAANVFGVSGWRNGFANKRDLKANMNPNTTFDLISVDDGINNQLPAGAGFFTNPDVQWAVGLATDVPITFISTGTVPNDIVTEMLDQAHYLLSLEHPPQTSLCNAYAQLAARGVSIIVQTGIWGAGSVPLPGCVSFDVSFPASCPFVTGVGSTEFDPDELQETVSSSSGGGFSKWFSRPKYQDTAVSTYLKATNNTQNTAFNVAGRAVPDLSAIFWVQWVIEEQVVDILSTPEYSAAIFASMVALLTNERIAAGKPGLGLLNPLLYANPQAFKDMTTGSNPGCGGFTEGFNATSGWDPVSGFGSPLFPKLQKICSDL